MTRDQENLDTERDLQTRHDHQDDDTEALASSVAEVATELHRKRLQVMDRVRVPDGRTGTLSMFIAETVVNGRATQAKVVFDDSQYGVFDVLYIRRA